MVTAQISEGGHSSIGCNLVHSSAHSSQEWASDIRETVTQCTLMAERWRTARQLRGDAAARTLTDAQTLLNLARRAHAPSDRIQPAPNTPSNNILPPRGEQPAIRRNRRPAATGPQAHTNLWECRIKRPNKLQSHRCRVEIEAGDALCSIRTRKVFAF